MTVKGYIKEYDGGCLTIVAPFTNDYLLQKQGISECEIRLDDGRKISADQRKKIYATMRDISEYSGHTPDEIKEFLKYDYIANTGADSFSLSNVDMTTANSFLTFIIDFCIEHEIPTDDNLADLSPDIGRYVYKCLAEKKSCVSRRKAELHHVDAIGMGRNRKDVIHRGMRVLPLTRKEHTEIHTIGYREFMDKYHVCAIKLDSYLCDIWKVGR